MIHNFIYPQYYKNDGFHVDGIYHSWVKHGKETAKTKSIIFCGLCRDVERVIEKNIRWLENLGQTFNDYRIILFENDSEDKTRQIIERLQKSNPKIELITCEYLGSTNCKFNEMKMYDLGPLSQKRIEKMSFFRNQYLSRIKQNYTSFDYVMMLDMDIKGYFNRNGLYEVLAKEQEWDAVFVNGKTPIIGFYDLTYDALALVLVNEDFKKFIQKDGETSSLLNIVEKCFHLQLFESKFKPVKSCFNGCGIYKMETIKNSSFYPEYTCEWIGFHKDMFEKGFQKMFIARDWKLYVGRQGPSL